MSSEDNNQDGGGELNSTLSEGGEQEFVTEEKKPFNRNTLVLFGIIVAGLAGYYLMYIRGGPAKASASSVEAQAADKTIQQFLTDSQKIKLMEKMLRSTEKVVEQFKSYPSMTQVPLQDLKANPFKFLPLKSVDDNPGDVANAAASRKRDQERAAATKAVEGLQLQSIVAGGRRACMINNAMYSEGQKVEEFTIEKILPDGVIVRTGVFRFQLAMQKRESLRTGK